MDSDLKNGLKGAAIAVLGVPPLAALLMVGIYFVPWLVFILAVVCLLAAGGFVYGIAWSTPGWGSIYSPPPLPPWPGPPDGGEPLPKPDNVVRLAANVGKRV